MLGEAITITRDAAQLTITSKIHISKRYLKYLTKKFLKKQLLRDYIRVIARTKNGYFLRYFVSTSTYSSSSSSDERAWCVVAADDTTETQLEPACIRAAARDELLAGVRGSCYFDRGFGGSSSILCLDVALLLCRTSTTRRRLRRRTKELHSPSIASILVGAAPSALLRSSLRVPYVAIAPRTIRRDGPSRKRASRVCGMS